MEFCWDPRPETQDCKGGTRGLRPGIQLMDGTQEPRPEILKVGPTPETRDTYFTWDLRPGAQDTEKRI